MIAMDVLAAALSNGDLVDLVLSYEPPWETIRFYPEIESGTFSAAACDFLDKARDALGLETTLDGDWTDIRDRVMNRPLNAMVSVVQTRQIYRHGKNGLRDPRYAKLRLKYGSDWCWDRGKMTLALDPRNDIVASETFSLCERRVHGSNENFTRTFYERTYTCTLGTSATAIAGRFSVSPGETVIVSSGNEERVWTGTQAFFQWLRAQPHLWSEAVVSLRDSEQIFVMQDSFFSQGEYSGNVRVRVLERLVIAASK